MAFNIYQTRESNEVTPALENFFNRAKTGFDLKNAAEIYATLSDLSPNSLIKGLDDDWLDKLAMVAGMKKNANGEWKATTAEDALVDWFNKLKEKPDDEKIKTDKETLTNFESKIRSDFIAEGNDTNLLEKQARWNFKNILNIVQPSTSMTWTHSGGWDSKINISGKTISMIKALVPRVLALGNSGQSYKVVRNKAVYLAHERMGLGPTQYRYKKGYRGEKDIHRGGSMHLAFYAPNAHPDKAIRENHVAIIENILADKLKQHEGDIRKYGTDGNEIIDAYGTAVELIGEQRVDLIEDVNEPWTYNLIIHPIDTEDDAPYRIPGKIRLDRATAQPYLDTLQTNIAANLDDDGVIANRNIAKASGIPTKIAKVQTRIVDKIGKFYNELATEIKHPLDWMIDVDLEKHVFGMEGSPNKSAIDRIIGHESGSEDKFLKFKKPDSKGFTVGHGSNINFMEPDELKYYNKVTNNGKLALQKHHANELVRMRVGGIVKQFNKTKSFKFSKMTRNRRDALINVVYQMGWTNFNDPEIGFVETIKHIKKGDWVNASKEILNSKWAREQTPTRAREISALLRDG